MIRNEIMNFISIFFANLSQVLVINTTMMNSELSLHNRGATTIRTDYKLSWDFQTTRHMQVPDLHIPTYPWIL